MYQSCRCCWHRICPASCSSSSRCCTLTLHVLKPYAARNAGCHRHANLPLLGCLRCALGEMRAPSNEKPVPRPGQKGSFAQQVKVDSMDFSDCNYLLFALLQSPSTTVGDVLAANEMLQLQIGSRTTRGLRPNLLEFARGGVHQQLTCHIILSSSIQPLHLRMPSRYVPGQALRICLIAITSTRMKSSKHGAFTIKCSLNAHGTSRSPCWGVRVVTGTTMAATETKFYA